MPPPDDIDLARVICPLHELGELGARGFRMGEGEWPLRGFVVRTRGFRSTGSRTSSWRHTRR
jgi:hypothetical protein